MITAVFFLALLWVVWKIIVLGLKMTWGIVRILCSVLLLPAILIGLVCVGMMYVALPVLIVIGILVVVGLITNR